MTLPPYDPRANKKPRTSEPDFLELLPAMGTQMPASTLFAGAYYHRMNSDGKYRKITSVEDRGLTGDHVVVWYEPKPYHTESDTIHEDELVYILWPYDRHVWVLLDTIYAIATKYEACSGEKLGCWDEIEKAGDLLRARCERDYRKCEEEADGRTIS